MPEKFVITDLDPDKPVSLSAFFGRNAPLEIDLGCGKGRFLAARASKIPSANFIGIERKMDRVRRVEKKIHRLQLSNVRIIRVEAELFMGTLLPALCLSTLYTFYPDPWPKRRHHTRRLFSPDFMNSLARVLVPEGTVHAATDHLDYFEHIIKLVEGDPRFARVEPFVPDEEERTEFETIFLKLGFAANRISFRKI